MKSASLPKSLDEKAEAYLKAMMEVKARFKVIADMQTLQWPHNLRIEVCYLQLRHICELVTAGALIIQGDYQGALGDSYAPGPIFKKLESKYGEVFPRAMKISKTEKQINVDHAPVIGAITKAEFLKLWSQAGDKLHRLKISKFFAAYDEDVSDNVSVINVHATKLWTLLKLHSVPILSSKTLVLMALNPEGSKPSMAFMELGGDSTHVRSFNVKGATNFFHE